MNISNINDNIKTVSQLIDRRGVFISPTQGIGKSLITNAINKFMMEGWDTISSKEKEILREVVRNNPRISFKKEVPQND